MRWLGLAVALGLGCAHAPAPQAGDALPGEVLVGTEAGLTADQVVALAKLDGFEAAYGGAASGTAHLLRFSRTGGAALTAEETAALVQSLQGRPGLKFAEANRRRDRR